VVKASVLQAAVTGSTPLDYEQRCHGDESACAQKLTRSAPHTGALRLRDRSEVGCLDAAGTLKDEGQQQGTQQQGQCMPT